MSSATETPPALEAPAKPETHAQKAAAAAVANVRSDLGEELAESFKKARALILKHEEDVDALMPVSLMLTEMLAKVPVEKSRSAGYAELLFAYGQVTFAFAKKSIYETTILGGDVEAAALKSTLEDALRSKADKKSSKAKDDGADSEKPSADATEPKEGDTNGDVKKVEEDAKEEKPTDSSEPEEKSGGDVEKASKEKSADVESEKDSKKDEAKVEPTEKLKAGEKKDEANGEQHTNPEAAKKKDEATNANSKKAGGEDEITAADDDDEEKEDKDDVDNETLTWEQYEYARMIFEELGAAQRKRLAPVYEALGDLLLETDQHTNAAKEYANALTILAEADEAERDLRAMSHLSYQRYLALRGSSPADALTALDGAVEHFAKYAEKYNDKETKDTLRAMQEDRTAFKEALPKDALAAVKAGSDAPVQVVQPRRKTDAEPTVVQPRRKVRKVAEIDDDDDAPAAKKARIETPSDAPPSDAK